MQGNFLAGSSSHFSYIGAVLKAHLGFNFNGFLNYFLLDIELAPCLFYLGLDMLFLDELN